jgi:general secretion pathway protein J
MSRTAHAGKNASAGYAVIEALASLVIIAMIGLMLFQGIGTGTRVWERVDARQAGRESVDAAQSALRDRLEEIYPATLYEQIPPTVDFSGEAHHVVFISSPPLADRPAPVRRYGLLLDSAGQLILTSVSDVAPRTDTVINQVVLSGVRGLDVAYFGALQPDLTPGWRAAWESRGELPDAIRVRVLFQPGDRRIWPDLIVHPRATIDTGCSLEPTSHGCKGR